MNKLMYLLFTSVFLLDYLAVKLNLINKYVALLPEFITMVTAVIVLALSTQGRVSVTRGVAILLGLYLMNILIGMVLNALPSGVLIAGLRSYLKFLPLVLLPMVFRFNEDNIKKIFLLILFLCLLQAPIAVYQKIFQFRGVMTGDVVTGTANSSGLLSVILYCAVSVVVAFYVKNRIKLSTMLIITLFLVLPTTINGTKASIIFLPIATALPLLMSSQKGKLRKLMPIAIVLAILAVVLVSIADSVYDRKNLDSGVMDFFSREGRLESYLYRGIEEGDRFQHMGKIDSYVLPLSILSNDPWKLAFGLGIGNVAGSSISSLSGEYAAEYAIYGPGVTAMSQLIWELGVSGAVLYLLLFYSIFKSSVRLSRSDGFSGAVAHGWSVAIVIVFISLFYKNLLQENIVLYCFWFISGYVVSENMRLKRKPVDETALPEQEYTQVPQSKFNSVILKNEIE